MHVVNADHIISTRHDALKLRVSSIFFWLFMLVAMVLLLDPTNPGLDGPTGNTRLPRELGPIKYIGIVFGWLALLFGMLGLSLNQSDKSARLRAIVARSWPITLYALLMLGGSLFARLVLGQKETFLQGAAGVTAYFIGLVYILEAHEPFRVVRTYFVFLLAASAFMSWEIAKRWAYGGQAFHEEIFLLVPLAVYFFLANRDNWTRWFWVIGFTGVAVVSYKNTSFLVLILTLGYLGLLLTWEKLTRNRRDNLRRMIIVYGVTVSIVAVLIALMFAYFTFQENLPGGSVEVRTRAYAAVWERFLESPIYGSLFAGAIHVNFDLYPILGGNVVVTHSDLMDALAQGGMIGLLLFVAAYVTPFRLARLHSPATDPRLYAALHGLRAVALSGIIVLLFNPIVLGLQINSLYWLSVGLMVGLAVRYRHDNGSARVKNGKTES